MVKVSVTKQSNYPVGTAKIKNRLAAFLKNQGIVSDAEVSVAIVGDRKMRALSKKYKGEDKTRNILSFSLSEGESTHLGSEVLKLGDIVISYPQIIREASVEEVLVDDKIDTLIEHGMLHLLGINHE